MRPEKTNENPESQRFSEEDAFTGGDAYPNCDGEACANVAAGDENTESVAEKMAEEAAEWRDKYTRLSAEFDNYRKRTLREKMEMASTAGEDVIKALLPVIDDIDRALEAMETSSDLASIKEGVVLISHKLLDMLRNRGVSEIKCIGQELDTDFHEAIAKIEAEKKDKGKIVDVVQKGYKMNDKVIRHSKVVVGE